MSAPTIQTPVAVREIADRLEHAGFETWCVGGAVRDALLGRADLDWDLATAATPGDVKRLFSRTVPVGIEHGTIGVFGRDGRLHEVTTFRADVETDGRHAVVKFGVSLEEDLARRDFTINAMAWSPARAELRDPFGGRADLASRCIRAVGVPAQRMEEDRLRALRAIRFAARFDFRIEADTWHAIVASAPALTRLSVERVLQEWTKTLEQVQCPSAAIQQWRAAGALSVLLPALQDVPDEYIRAMDHVPRGALTARPERQALRQLTRLSLPFVALGPDAARRTLLALRASNHDASHAAALAAAWDAGGDALTRFATQSGEPEAPLRRIVSHIGRTRVLETMRAFAAIWAARRAAQQPAPSSGQIRRLTRRMYRMAVSEPIALGDLAVDGDDLRRAGVRPGPLLGRILHQLLDRVLDDPSRNTRDHLLALAQAMAEEH